MAQPCFGSSKNPIWPWLVAFLLINLMARDTGGVNTLSRFATLKAMVVQKTFRIDSYRHWTHDWAQTPDGHYYSNKAPGPMFIGYPVFYFIESLTGMDSKRTGNGEEQAPPVRPFIQFIVSFIVQVIPYMILCVLCIRYLQQTEISEQAILFAGLALLFGNTASVYMNLYFGHGIAAIFILLMCLFMLKKNYFGVGLAYGLTLLCDYGAGLMLPPLVLSILFQNKRDLSWIKPFLLGGIFPGVLWCWYHISCFGSPFTIPGAYQNPMFKDAIGEKNLGGIFYASIKWDIVVELLFGKVRGILFTQPWLIIFLPAAVLHFILFRQETFA